MENRDIAALFEKMADLLEFKGANPFRVRAYRNGARRLLDLPDSIESLVENGEDLTQLDGIGKDLAEKVATLVRTGELPQLNELMSEVPEGVLALFAHSWPWPQEGSSHSSRAWRRFARGASRRLRRRRNTETQRLWRKNGANDPSRYRSGRAGGRACLLGNCR